MAFGGGGPLHAAAVARELGIGRIVVPRHPGLFSARGIATADFAHVYVQSVLRPVADTDPDTVLAVMETLMQRAVADLDAEGIPGESRELSHMFDLRYVGQTTEIPVPVQGGGELVRDGFRSVTARFHRLHERLYSYSVPEEPVELVNLRLHAVGRVGTLPLPVTENTDAQAGPAGERAALMPGDAAVRSVPVYRRAQLVPDVVITGPALVEEASSTTVVLEDMTAEVDSFGNLVLGPAGRGWNG